MSDVTAVEQRLARIESELEAIKARLDPTTKTDWISQMSGQFRNDPVFDEIVRLGKEIRDSEACEDDGQNFVRFM